MSEYTPYCTDQVEERRFRTEAIALLLGIYDYYPSSQSIVPTNTFAEVTGPAGSYTIPEGVIHAAIAVESGVADVDGIEYSSGQSIQLPPMSFGVVDRRYPEINITGVSGVVKIHFSA